METTASGAAVPAVGRRRDRLGTAAAEAVPALVVAAFGLILAARAALDLNQDGWLALVGGREIVKHGLPSTDTLAYWTRGREWVDQQWLGQIGMYALHSLGGTRVLIAGAVAAGAAAFAIAVAAARALGGSQRSVALVALVAFVPAVLDFSQVRTQTFAAPLFAACVWLLAADARRPMRRVYLVLPLLVIWANVHGTALLGAGLVTLAGLSYAWTQGRLPHGARARRWGVRAAVLGVAPWLCTIASPYALSLPAYYRATALNPDFGHFVTEWRPTSLAVDTAPVFVLIGAGLWLLGRSGSSSTLFERLLFLTAALVGLAAVRNLGWLALTAVIVLPRLLDTVVPTRAGAARADRVLLAVAAGLGVLAAAVLVGGSQAQLATRYPPPAAAEVRGYLAAHPHARVFADLRLADWLLWAVPEARGRIAVDVRFELLPQRRLRQLQRWNGEATDGWRAAAAGASVVALDRLEDARKLRALRPAWPALLYRGRTIAILARG